MYFEKKYLTFFFFLSLILFCQLICLPEAVLAAEFEISRDNEDLEAEDTPYEDDFDSVFDDPAEDIVVEQPADIDYRNQFEESKKIVVSGDFVIRAGGGFGWTDEPFDGYPEKVAGAYSKATISFDARPDPTIRIFGKLKTEMDSDNGSDVWSKLDFDELYCDYNWLDKSFFRLGKFYMTWGQGRLFRPANFMEDCEDGTSFRMTMPNVLDGVTLVSLYKKYPGSPNDGKLHKGDVSLAGHADKTLGPINFSAAMLYNQMDGQRYSGSVKTVILGTDLFADYVLNRSDEGDITHEALAGFYHEWENIKFYGEYYYDGRIEDDVDHCVGLATDFDNLFGSPVGMGFKWLHSVTDNAGQFIGGFSISPWKHVKIRMAIPWQYGDKELDKDFYEEFPINSKLAFTLFV
ncbi:MAG: hypothetical protein IJQ27_04130, partial [Spirochaetia bacterium]|nr:hypothetical protein [Spirochaetia bacterium]